MTNPPVDPRDHRLARRAPAALAIVVLLLGAFGVFVRHAPATTWALPVHLGPLVGDSVVWGLRRSPGEVRVDVGPKDLTATVRIVERHHPDRAPGELTTAHTRLLPNGSQNRLANPEELHALADLVTRWEQRWPPPPPFVGPVGHKPTPLQQVEAITLEALIVVWLAGLVATVRAWWPRRPVLLAIAAAGVVVQHAASALLDLGGVWHSNQHGYDRIADVVGQTPPAFAALGLLHGYGYYALFQPLIALTGGDVFTVAGWVGSATVVATVAWLALLWDDPRQVSVGVLALVGSLVFLRLSASEDMYVPTQLWVTATLALLERYLRDDRDRWLLLALPPAFLAMQTRAEMMALVPAWAGLLVVVRKPTWLGSAWRRPAVVGGLGFAALLFVPRLLELRSKPPPEDLRRASLDPLRDPRLLVVVALALVGVALLPPVARRLAATSRAARALGVGAGVLALGLGALALRPTGGPLENTLVVHAALDPRVSGLLPLVLVGGVVSGAKRAPATVAWLLLSMAVGLAVYLPQYDCFSTYVRTSLATWPLVVALVAPAGATTPGAGGAALALAVSPAFGLADGSLTTPDAKQLQWDLVERIAATVPPDAALVWLSDADVPADAAARGYRTTRARLDRWLPELKAVGIDAWRAGAVPEGTPTFFVRTADCHRVLFQPRGQKALAGEAEVGWRYLDVSRVSRGPRVAIDVPADWIDPRCAATLAASTETLVDVPLPPENSGSIYETLVGAPRLGLHRIPSRP